MEPRFKVNDSVYNIDTKDKYKVIKVTLGYSKGGTWHDYDCDPYIPNGKTYIFREEALNLSNKFQIGDWVSVTHPEQVCWLDVIDGIHSKLPKWIGFERHEPHKNVNLYDVICYELVHDSKGTQDYLYGIRNKDSGKELIYGENSLERVKRIEYKTLAERVKAEGRTSSISMGCSTEGQIPASEYRRILGIPKDFASDEEISKVLDNKSDKKIYGESPVSKALQLVLGTKDLLGIKEEDNYITENIQKAFDMYVSESAKKEKLPSPTEEVSIEADMEIMKSFDEATKKELVKKFNDRKLYELGIKGIPILSYDPDFCISEVKLPYPLKRLYGEYTVDSSFHEKKQSEPITTWTFRLKFPNGDEVEVPEPPKDQWRLDETITCDWPHRYIKEIYACMENYVRDLDTIEEQAKCWWHDYADRAWEENAQVLWKKLWHKIPEKKPEPEKPVWEFL